MQDARVQAGQEALGSRRRIGRSSKSDAAAPPLRPPLRRTRFFSAWAWRGVILALRDGRAEAESQDVICMSRVVSRMYSLA